MIKKVITIAALIALMASTAFGLGGRSVAIQLNVDKDYGEWLAGSGVVSNEDSDGTINRLLSTYGNTISTTVDTWEPLFNLGALPAWTTTARVYQCDSSSANDAAAGTGARTITLYGVDANCSYQTETITLNGTNNVETDNSFLQVGRIAVTTTGTGLDAAGNIKCYKAGSTTELLIDAGDNHSEMAYVIVPESVQPTGTSRSNNDWSYYGLLHRLNISSNSTLTAGGADFAWRVRYHNLDNRITKTYMAHATDPTTLPYVPEVPPRISECTALWLEINHELADTAEFYGDLEFTLHDTRTGY